RLAPVRLAPLSLAAERLAWLRSVPLRSAEYIRETAAEAALATEFAVTSPGPALGVGRRLGLRAAAAFAAVGTGIRSRVKPRVIIPGLRSASRKSLPDMLAWRNRAPRRSARKKTALLRSADSKFAPKRSARPKSVPERIACMKLAPVRIADVRRI